MDAVIAALEQAVAEGRLSAGAGENIRRWLEDARYAPYRDQVVAHIERGDWKTLDDVFWTIIPFGTGGRRGRMYPIGSNAINDRTIGESAQGVADYILSQFTGDGPPSAAIAYDTRHRSRHFAELCAGVLAAAGFRVYFLDDYRSTPQLSFLVRYRNCHCGIMVTASHNPPSDNAVKVYWSTGGQVLPPHDKAIIERVMQVKEIRSVPFDEALRQGRVVICTDEVDRAYQAAVLEQRFEGPRQLRILYSPLHGVGAASVVPILKADGFDEVQVYEPHAKPDGDFPNVPGHSANPENPAVFDAMIDQARRDGFDLVLATDPDCDRLGCAAPVTADSTGPWAPLTGNQIGALLADFVLAQRSRRNTLSPEHYVVKTLVTTELIRRIADAYQVRTVGNLHVGFKWIGGVMDQLGPELFVLGTEESHGYLVGSYARDKDGAVAAMLLAELAAALRSQGKTLHERLYELYRQHGCHVERLMNVQMEGSEGMQRMAQLMESLRQSPPATLGGMPVVAVEDYQSLVCRNRDGSQQPLDAPRGNMVILRLETPGNAVAVRPSGTEPKVKFYFFAWAAPCESANVPDACARLESRIAAWQQDVRQLVAACR
ncbi:MAG: phosphomannomutase [Pirellulaceae bacterium]|nr:MAG: phosphomannomutase [Pirellulaceae bacterium]